MTQYNYTSNDGIMILPKYHVKLRGYYDPEESHVLTEASIVSYDPSTNSCHISLKNFILCVCRPEDEYRNNGEYIDMEVVHVHVNLDDPSQNYVINQVIKTKSELPSDNDLFKKTLDQYAKRIHLEKIRSIDFRDLWFADEYSFANQNVYIGYAKGVLEFDKNYLTIHYKNNSICHDNKNYPPYVAFKSEKQDGGRRYHARLEFTPSTIINIPIVETDLEYHLDLTKARLTNHHATKLVDCNFESIFAVDDDISTFDPDYIDTMYHNLKLIQPDGQIRGLIQHSQLYFSVDHY